jgi:uncharacterized protein (TIGR02449 family)
MCRKTHTRPFDRCGGSAGEVDCEQCTLLLPVELRHVNHTASTNAFILGANRIAANAKPYNHSPMSNPTQIDQIAERVERLLVRHQELQRTNALLAAQVDSLVLERDSLKSRLGAARARVDALLDRLPHPAPDAHPVATPATSAKGTA